MCWQYEDKYNNCFDHVWQMFVDDGVVDILEANGVEFVDKEKCKVEFFNLLTAWHEKGLIKPSKNDV